MKNEKSELLIMLLYEHFPYSRWVTPFCNRVYAELTKVQLSFREKLKKNRGNLGWTLFLSKRSSHTWWCNYSLRSYFERYISDCCAVEFHDWSCSCRVTQWDWYTIGSPISFSSIDIAVKMIDNLAGQCYTGKDEEQTRGPGQGPLVRALGCISAS